MKNKKTLFILLALTLFIAVLSPCAYASADSSSAGRGGLTGVADRGDVLRYPENSLEGVLSAAGTGIDGVLVDVSLSKDGVPVVIEAKSAKRMLYGADRENVSDYTAAELKQFRLRDLQGGEHNGETESTVSTLEEMLTAAKQNGFMLVPMFDASITDKVTAAVDSAGAYDSALLFITGKKSAVKEAAKSAAGKYRVMVRLRSNIVFEVTSFIREMKENGVEYVNLQTTNRYGVIFYRSVLKRFSGGTYAAADTSRSLTCGAREDCVKWWDDLVSRGFSLVITAAPEEFARYKNDCLQARDSLKEAYDLAVQTELPEFGKEILNDHKKAYEDAEKTARALLDADFASAGDMRDCAARLYSAVKEIDLNYEELAAGTAGLTVTPARIVLCILAAAAVTAVQIYFYKKRKEKK